jgi:hypothetical protein
MVCNDLSEMVLELKILFHGKVAIQQINQYKLMKQETHYGYFNPIILFY